MASHSRTGLPALLLGSETRKVLQESKIPVLVDR
jgi:nucleotide-binding universal stress UspA family protein